MEIPSVAPIVRSFERPYVLHISDTPSSSYRFIFRLVDQLKPKYLIHTGDMIDEIKLEIRPGRLPDYVLSFQKIIRLLEALPVEQIYLIPGNHDDLPSMRNSSQRCVILPERSWLELEGRSFFLTHQYEEVEVDADYYLFGHNLPEIAQNDPTSGPQKLNGIPAINIISLASGEVKKIPYPSGTDSARTVLLPRIGL